MGLLDLGKKDMDDYNKLIRAYTKSEIQSMNQAIRDADSQKAQEYLLRIQQWNQRVMVLEDIRVSLNAKLKHLRLPSAGMLTVLYDDITRQWRFNAEPG